ncbi:contactin-1-like [Thalassophryne amazonica]|uniref:contactin-1-like n=1 Tax=Thalassophryne amazonica TaxID=390379 RepID=UPI001470F3B3|nr:contactin-1-like [Thalassophryne amazonica]
MGLQVRPGIQISVIAIEASNITKAKENTAGKPISLADVSPAELIAITPPGASDIYIMLHLMLLLNLLVFRLTPADASVYLYGEAPDFYRADDATGYGPVFEEQPVDTIYPEESPEAKITMNCRARAKPPAIYK